MTQDVFEKLAASEAKILELESELMKLRKIAAFVPGLIYIKAKEVAGFGEVIRTSGLDEK